jgi:uncharacterized protein YkwD
MRENVPRTAGAIACATACAALLAVTPATAEPAPGPSATEARTAAAAAGASIGRGVSAEKRSAAHHYSRKLAMRMNVVRRQHHLRPIRVVRCLNGFAGPWAHHLARTGDFYHQDLQPMLAECNLSSVGEIIAKGPVTPRRMIRMWLDSPDHRELLLERSFRIAGVAGRRGGGSWVGCIDFGRRRAA